MDNNRQEEIICKVAIINLGCKVNKYESDSMKNKLMMAGFSVVDPEDQADFYIVNTCSVTNMAQKKSRQMLRRAKKRNPNAVVIAAGCYVNAEHDVLKNEDFVDVVVSNNCKKDIVEVINEYRKNSFVSDYYIDINRTKEYEEMGELEASSLNHHRAYIKIQDGCNQFCSYCIIPYTRGRVRSRKPEYILKEIEKLANEGVKEFVLTGIHISSYGVDFAGEDMQYEDLLNNEGLVKEDTIRNLGDLMVAIAKIEKVKRIRLGSLEPRIVTDDFLKKLKEIDEFCPHFHLSLQSACNDTLKRMNRKYTIEEFEEKCKKIRNYFEKPAITTDVIVGFPGETEEEFRITLNHLKNLHLYEIHVFKYSVRTGTVAEKLPNQISEEIKGERSEQLLKLTQLQKKEFEEEMNQYEDEVLIEEALEEKNGEELIEVTAMDQNLQGKDEDGKYYIGHTKRYIKVKLFTTKEQINQVIRVKFV